jgi:hypothetical protein
MIISSRNAGVAPGGLGILRADDLRGRGVDRWPQLMAGVGSLLQ